MKTYTVIHQPLGGGEVTATKEEIDSEDFLRLMLKWKWTIYSADSTLTVAITDTEVVIYQEDPQPSVTVLQSFDQIIG